MRRRTWAALTTLVGAAAALAAAAAPAAACSLEQLPREVTLPPRGATLGPRPLLLAGVNDGLPLLEDVATHTSILVARDPALDGVSMHGQALVGWRPVAPLPAGGYAWSGAGWGMDEATFFVDPSLAPAAPAPRAVTLHVTLTEPDESGGSCGAVSSCSDVDFTRMDLTLGAVAGDGEAAATYLLELTVPSTGASTRALVTPDTSLAGGRESIGVWDRWRAQPSFKSVRTCVALTPIGDDGTLGARVDLGCVDPSDDDPRVTDDRGCAAAGASDALPWVLAVLALRRRRA